MASRRIYLILLVILTISHDSNSQFNPFANQQAFTPFNNGGFPQMGSVLQPAKTEFNPFNQTPNPNVNIFNLFQSRSPVGTNAGFNQGSNQQNLNSLNGPVDYNQIDWTQIDRRAEEGDT